MDPICGWGRGGGGVHPHPSQKPQQQSWGAGWGQWGGSPRQRVAFLQRLSLQPWPRGFGTRCGGCNDPQSLPPHPLLSLGDLQGFPAPTAFFPTCARVQGLGWGAVLEWEQGDRGAVPRVVAGNRGVVSIPPAATSPLAVQWRGGERAFLAWGGCGRWFSDLARQGNRA